MREMMEPRTVGKSNNRTVGMLVNKKGWRSTMDVPPEEKNMCECDAWFISSVNVDFFFYTAEWVHMCGWVKTYDFLIGDYHPLLPPALI